jgi:MFS transporter, SP family, xylose:H+ symportor
MMSSVVNALHHNFVEPLGLENTIAAFVLGLIMCSTLFGTIAGSLLAKPIEKTLGRKLPVLLAAALFIVAALGSAFTEFGSRHRVLLAPASLLPSCAMQERCFMAVACTC